jgi:hypothetical protein
MFRHTSFRISTSQTLSIQQTFAAWVCTRKEECLLHFALLTDLSSRSRPPLLHIPSLCQNLDSLCPKIKISFCSVRYPSARIVPAGDRRFGICRLYIIPTVAWLRVLLIILTTNHPEVSLGSCGAVSYAPTFPGREIHLASDYTLAPGR